MHKRTQSSSAPPTPRNDSPEDILKRLFAVAELVAKSQTQSESPTKQERPLSEETQKDQTSVL